MSNFSTDVNLFIRNHTLLCASTLGIAIAIYAAGNLAGRAVAWLRTLCGTTLKTSTVAKSIHSDTPSPNNLGTRSISINPVSQATPEPATETSEAVPQRRMTYLPNAPEYLEKWAKLGITWHHDNKRNKNGPNKNSQQRCLLPEGWKYRYDSPSLDNYLLDHEGIPRVYLYHQNHPDMAVSFLSRDEGIRQLELERLLASEMEEKEAEADRATLDLVLSKRSAVWSEQCPFGVFVLKDIGDVNLAKWAIAPEERTCHGYFPTDGIAQKAVNILNKSAGKHYQAFYVQVTNLELAKSYVLVNFNTFNP